MTKAQKAEREEARAALREILTPGDTVWTVLRHVSKSGMSRDIDAYLLTTGRDGKPDRVWLSRRIARAGVGTWNDRRETVRMGGCGMDMGFALVYELSHALWPDGFECVGQGCPSNDHSNGDRDYAPHPHRDGGYALTHRWL